MTPQEVWVAFLTLCSGMWILETDFYIIILFQFVCICVLSACEYAYIYMFTCVRVHIREWACIHTEVPMHVEAWGWCLESYSISLPPYLLRQGLLIKSRVGGINTASLTSQLALRIPLSPLPQARITGRPPCLTGILSVSGDVHSCTGASVLTTEPFS